MTYFDGKRLNQIKEIPLDVKNILKKANITSCEDLLTLPPSNLMAILQCSESNCDQLLSIVSQAVAPTPQTGLSMYCQDNKKIPTSLQSLDSHLLGGLPAGTLTEIAGPSGCGKTQFSMMLTVIADLPQHHGGIDSKTIYIDTEGAFTAIRLIEIAKSRHPDYYSHEGAVKRLTDRVIIYKVTSCAELDTRLMSLDFTVASEEIGLVIVDSIASLIRKEYDTRSVKRISDRSCYLVKQATLLKCLAQDYQIPVVVTNHITTRFVPGTCDGQVVASLGNHWSHCVNTRLVMEFTDDNNRMITVTKSSLCPPISIITRLEDKGLVLDCADLSEDFELKGDPNEHSLTVRTDLL